jgi:hypothetical protein
MLKNVGSNTQTQAKSKYETQTLKSTKRISQLIYIQYTCSVTKSGEIGNDVTNMTLYAEDELTP